MDHASTLRRPIRTLGAFLFLAMVIALAVLIGGYVNVAEMANRLAAARGWIGAHSSLAALIFAAVYVAVNQPVAARRYGVDPCWRQPVRAGWERCLFPSQA
ncbi:hypothetical protein [Mesorhizobium captivum]|uniref:hypothetical protein n=1 Tax=Mesorhizobium captivum TaxID=3072319 RepID=UPI002A24DB95|nr:hypothetical protein [Mesorhizobium sp. VK3C]MDX8449416.1 hypothetical protein [Mesorhizobium sp. VK3C]